MVNGGIDREKGHARRRISAVKVKRPARGGREGLYQWLGFLQLLRLYQRLRLCQLLGSSRRARGSTQQQRQAAAAAGADQAPWLNDALRSAVASTGVRSRISLSCAFQYSFLPSRCARAAMITATEWAKPRSTVAFGWLRAAQTLQPVLHVAGIAVGDKRKRAVGLFDRAVQAMRCDHDMERRRSAASSLMYFSERRTNGLSSWVPFSSTSFQRWLPSPPILMSVALLAHDSGEAVGVVAEAGGIAHQESLRIFEKRLEGIGIFAAIVPREDAAHAPRPTVGK